MEQGNESGPRSTSAIDRRRFIRRTAVVGGAVWAAPTLLTVDRASAVALTSPPPNGEEPPEVEPDTIEQPDPGVPDGTGGDQPEFSSPDVAGGGTERSGTLPRTGADTDKLVVTGVAAVAAGTALTMWSADSPLSADGAPAEADPEA